MHKMVRTALIAGGLALEVFAAAKTPAGPQDERALYSGAETRKNAPRTQPGNSN